MFPIIYFLSGQKQPQWSTSVTQKQDWIQLHLEKETDKSCVLREKTFSSLVLPAMLNMQNGGDKHFSNLDLGGTKFAKMLLGGDIDLKILLI